MKTFGNFIKWFLYITVGILIVCGISYKLAGVKTVPVDLFGMILLSAFATTFITVIILPKEEDGKLRSGVKFLLHYIVLCVIMCFLGCWFGWMHFEAAGVAMMAIDVALVYLFSFLAHYIIDIRQADAINKVLQEKYGDEEV